MIAPIRLYRFAVVALVLLLAGCDVLAVPDDPGDAPIGTPGPAPGGTDPLVGLWRSDFGAPAGSMQHFIDIGSDLNAAVRARYAGAGGCWETSASETLGLRLLADSLYQRTYYRDGAVSYRDTAIVQLDGTSLRMGWYDDGFYYYNGFLRSTLTVGTPCPFQLMGRYSLSRLNGQTLPATYTFLGLDGVSRTFRVTSAWMFFYAYDPYSPLYLDQTNLTSGTASPHEFHGSYDVTSDAGAFDVRVTSTSVSLRNVVLGGTATPSGVTVTLSHDQLETPLTLEMTRFAGLMPTVPPAMRPLPEPARRHHAAR